MKLRIKGNSLRVRVSVPEVQMLSSGFSLREKTDFGDTQFVYAVVPGDGNSMTATFENDMITLSVPRKYVSGWAGNGVVGFDEMVTFSNGESLRLLLEKDFKCLDVTEEDQADYFENPAKSC